MPSAHRSRRVEAVQLHQALAPVERDLQAVSSRLLSQLADPIARKVVYLVTAGGKRLRPALVLLTGAVGPSPDRPALIDTATSVELIHTATLIHDDIIDQATMRRARPSFHQRWGTERALLMGDYLYSTAFTMLSRLEQPAVIQVLADVCQQLCRGELREVEARFRLDLTEAEYFAIIQEKTASLTGGCCRSGAILSGCSATQVEQLAAFGQNFGVAFQIIDDCLDLIGDQRQLGKSILADLDKGALSLPIIYLAQQLSAKARNALFAPLRRHANDPAFLRRVAKAAKESGAVAKAQARAAGFIRRAEASVHGIEMNGLRIAYESLTDYAIYRQG
ncbi:MAG: polyprenyl synthetase family protein [Candidatus Omnitrophica bacterium]|nr:polyprenyl synthetase family protein [Candidatus Omnitrophota bacterium]